MTLTFETSRVAAAITPAPGPKEGGRSTLPCPRVFPGLTITQRDDTTSPVSLRVHQRRGVPYPCRRQGWGLFGLVRCRMDCSNPCQTANDCSRFRWMARASQGC